MIGMQGATTLNAVGISLDFEGMLAAPQALGTTALKLSSMGYCIFPILDRR